MNNNKMIKTMKSKSIIGAALVAIFTLGATTSCTDMFDIESSRVVYEQDHDLSSTADSAYTTMGVLQSLRQVADRYIILGEVRGDLVDINEYTKTSLRNLSEFNFEDENEYLNVRDYYAIINNCNYALAKMDTTLTHNNQRVMIDEYAALLGIRAWTYMQLGINYGEVPYYTNPITTVADSEKDYPKLDIKELAAELIPQLTPYVDYDMPVFLGTNKVFPVLQLIVADLYLWSGDYLNACTTYMDYMTTHKDFNYSYGETGNMEYFRGYMGFNGSTLAPVTGATGLSSNLVMPTNWEDYLSLVVGTNGYENLAYITMERSKANGTVSEIASLFHSFDNTHPLNPSTYYGEICTSQVYIKGSTDKVTGELTGSYAPNVLANGDQRRKNNTGSVSLSDETFNVFNKFSSMDASTGTIELYTPMINLYRRAIVYLRAAEALNGLAKETGSDSLAVMSFNLLKDAYKVFFPNGHVLEKQLQEAFIGVHARGCGNVHLDTTHYVLKPEVIAAKLEKEGMAVEGNLNDTINYLDILIIDELAMEAALEGNRFGDLIRFAERRGEPEFLAKRVASRKGTEHLDEELYNKLLDKENWYLPLK